MSEVEALGMIAGLDVRWPKIKLPGLGRPCGEP